MQKLYGIVLCAFLLTGCATPPEVKVLAVKQTEYFDTAIEAVRLQSEALVIASEKLAEQARANIAAHETSSIKPLQDYVANNQLDATEAAQVAASISQATRAADQSRQQLVADLTKIKEKTAELNNYISKMKEVHPALDAYIQSKKAGEAIVSEIAQHPSVNSMLNTISELTPKIQSGVNEINSLMSTL